MALQQMLSQRGKKLLIYENFKFYRYKQLKTTGETCYSCVNKNCKVRLYTIGDGDDLVFSKICGVHDHQNISENVLNRQKVSNAVKRKATEDLSEKPSKLIHREINEQKTVLNILNNQDIRYIRNVISREKLKAVPKFPHSIEDIPETGVSALNHPAKVMADLSWDVICWEDEHVTDFVPSIWANESKTKYKYPTGLRMTEMLTRALNYNCVALQDGQYLWLNAKCKKSGIDNIDKAKAYCQMSLVTSNLESEELHSTSENEECDLRPQLKKLKKQKSLPEVEERPHFSSEMGQELNEPGPSSRNDFLIPSVVTGNIDKTKPYYQMSQITSNLEPEEPHTDFEDEEYDSQPPLRKNLYPEESHTDSEDGEYDLQLPSKKLKKQKSLPDLEEKPHFIFSETLSEISQELNEPGPSSRNDLLERLIGMEKSINEMRQQINRIEAMLEYLFENKNKKSPNGISSNFKNDFVDLLPCKTVEEVDHVESILVRDDASEALEELLFLAGGENSHKAIYNIMKKLLAPEVALQYSGLGKKQKLAFCKLKMYRVLTDAVRRRFKDAADVDIRKSVSTFLATGKDRLPKTNT